MTAASISLAAVGAIVTPARSAAPPASAAVTSFSIPGILYGVVASSARNAWAVGDSGVIGTDAKTLILHWNGTKWSQVTNPKPVFGYLNAIATAAPDDVWAVGAVTSPSATIRHVLVMHWNGRAWSRKTVPAVAGDLLGVAASGKNVWAVGVTSSYPSLIMHEIGNRWYVIPSEAPTSTVLSGVAVTGSKTAWADGYSYNGKYLGLLLRWNGTVWKPVSSPLQGTGNIFSGLAAGPAGAMWAVGDDTNPGGTATSMLWNGRSWRKVLVSGLSSGSFLATATFVRGGTAWAVGGDGSGAVILRWTGRAWTQVANPDDGIANSSLGDIAATSTSNAWAVGLAPPVAHWETLILHWNGKTWS